MRNGQWKIPTETRKRRQGSRTKRRKIASARGGPRIFNAIVARKAQKGRERMKCEMQIGIAVILIAIDGHKAFEMWDRETQKGEIQLLVDDRFVVEVHGKYVTMDQIKAALAKIDLKKLAALKPKGTAP
jgi:hypothetical protein